MISVTIFQRDKKGNKLPKKMTVAGSNPEWIAQRIFRQLDKGKK